MSAAPPPAGRPLARPAAIAMVAIIALGALAAPVLAPNPPDRQFPGYVSAPPMRVHLMDGGHVHAPFVYPLRLVDRLERRFAIDRTRRLALAWARGGTLLQMRDPADGPLLLLGGDPLGRDVFARLVYGARASLGVAALATLGALLVGVVAGGAAGARGGWTDDAVMRVADFLLVLPSVYVILALRAALPLVLPPSTVLALMAGLLALVGWPHVARGVRAIVAGERQRDYVVAARSLGAGPVRLLVRHLLPATAGFVAVEAALLMPAFILAEATLSFVGLGFPEPTASWGTMLAEAANIRAAAEMPWLLTPAIAIAVVVFSMNLAVGPSSSQPAA